ncbi:ferredoxin [Amycolatopsis sp. lyj-90]|uniref:ferredoxin n=1 Tax=Amycolatopsis sp. lyj-90 TaxID=2789285 RepID=UPI00397E5F45
MRVTVRTETCCGSGLCVVAVPEVFDHDDECVVTLLDDSPPAGLHESIREAARRCPTGTIVLHD